MVEFALLASLLFLLVMGIFDFGRAISVYINIAEAAHEGARQLVLRSNRRWRHGADGRPLSA
jgi:Flp pilus assembly protein TadG